MYDNSINLKGKKFGKLKVVEKTEKRQRGYVIWKCLCDCGNITYVTSNNLKHNLTRSCGCLMKKKNREENK